MHGCINMCQCALDVSICSGCPCMDAYICVSGKGPSFQRSSAQASIRSAKVSQICTLSHTHTHTQPVPSISSDAGGGWAPATMPLLLLRLRCRCIPELRRRRHHHPGGRSGPPPLGGSLQSGRRRPSVNHTSKATRRTVKNTVVKIWLSPPLCAPLTSCFRMT